MLLGATGLPTVPLPMSVTDKGVLEYEKPFFILNDLCQVIRSKWVRNLNFQDSAMQLTHAAQELRSKHAFKYDYQIAPLGSKSSSGSKRE